MASRGMSDAFNARTRGLDRSGDQPSGNIATIPSDGPTNLLDASMYIRVVICGDLDMLH